MASSTKSQGEPISSFLKKIPWDSYIIDGNGNINVDAFPAHQHVHLDVLLGLVSKAPGTLDKSSDQTASITARWLVVYRIIDTYVRLFLPTQLQAPLRVPRSSVFKQPSLPQWIKLHDWPNLLRDVYSSFLQSADQLSDTITDTSTNWTENLTICLTKSLLGSSVNTTLSNFDAAALYISRLFDGFTDIISDSSGRKGTSQNTLDGSTSLEGSETSLVISKLLQMAEPQSLRFPLQLALLVSPLVLFLPQNLIKGTFRRSTLIQLRCQLGGVRPPNLENVENIVWEALFLRSRTSNNSAFKIVEQALKKMNEHLARFELDDNDRHFFNLCQQIFIPPKRFPVMEEEEEEEEDEDDDEEEVKMNLCEKQETGHQLSHPQLSPAPTTIIPVPQPANSLICYPTHVNTNSLVPLAACTSRNHDQILDLPPIPRDPLRFSQPMWSKFPTFLPSLEQAYLLPPRGVIGGSGSRIVPVHRTTLALPAPAVMTRTGEGTNIMFASQPADMSSVHSQTQNFPTLGSPDEVTTASAGIQASNAAPLPTTSAPSSPHTDVRITTIDPPFSLPREDPPTHYENVTSGSDLGPLGFNPAPGEANIQSAYTCASIPPMNTTSSTNTSGTTSNAPMALGVSATVHNPPPIMELQFPGVPEFSGDPNLSHSPCTGEHLDVYQHGTYDNSGTYDHQQTMYTPDLGINPMLIMQASHTSRSKSPSPGPVSPSTSRSSSPSSPNAPLSPMQCDPDFGAMDSSIGESIQRYTTDVMDTGDDSPPDGEDVHTSDSGSEYNQKKGGRNSAKAGSDPKGKKRKEPRKPSKASIRAKGVAPISTGAILASGQAGKNVLNLNRLLKRPFVGPNKVLAVIDLPEHEDETAAITPLDVVRGAERQATVTHRFHGVEQSDTEDIEVSFHFPDDHAWLSNLMDHIKSCMETPQTPAHQMKTTSTFHTMSQREFRSRPPAYIQHLFREKNIIVTDVPMAEMQFDLHGLQTLASLDTRFTVHDQSIPITRGPEDRHRSGTIQDLLNSAQSPDGNILNAIDFPMPIDGASVPQALASHKHAFLSTLRTYRSVEYPSSLFSWGLAATAGAYHKFHLDHDGLGTCVEVRVGQKFWVIATPKDPHGSADASWYSEHQYDLGNLPRDKFDVEGILLKAGQCLFMRPNTLHSVFTPAASICHGAHFYAMSTLADSCFGLIHTFLERDLTNCYPHDETRIVLGRMVLFIKNLLVSEKATNDHIPNIHTWEGLSDLILLCIVTELGNVLHPDTYTPRDVSVLARQRLIDYREAARLVVEFLDRKVQLSHPSQPDRSLRVIPDFYMPYLAQVARTLVNVKERNSFSDSEGDGSNSEMYGDEDRPTSKDIDREIRLEFKDNRPFLKHYREFGSSMTFAWKGPIFDLSPADYPKLTTNISGLTSIDSQWRECVIDLTVDDDDGVVFETTSSHGNHNTEAKHPATEQPPDGPLPPRKRKRRNH